MAWNYNRRSSKYGEEKVKYNGMVFDSKRECRRYQELEILQKIGEISELRTQVKFVLIPAQREPDTIGKRGGKIKGDLIEREVSYIADFVYVENDKTVVEDAKGMRTREYILKRKMMLYFYGIRIKEV